MMRSYFIAMALLLSFAPFAAHATQVQEVVSPGGLKAWLVEEHALPLVAVKVAFRSSGSAYDPPGREGLTAMVSAMMLEGAGDMDSHAFNEAIENDAVRMNFGSDDDVFRASLETLSEHTDRAFGYLALALAHPRFDDAAIERVRAQTLSMLKEQEHQPHYLLQRQWEQLAFGKHPYGNPSLGTPESVSAIKKDDLARYAAHYLTRENMLIAVVGDITPQELARQLDAHFSGIAAHYQPDVSVAEARLPETAKQMLVDDDIPQTMVMFGTNGLKRDDPDYYAAYVMNQILGGGGALTSKLGIEIRQKRGLAYSVYSQMEPMEHAAIWGGGFATRSDQVGEALKTLRGTLADFAANGPTDAEMDDAKKHLVGSFVLGLDSNGDIAGFLINMQQNHLGRDYLDKRNALMQAVRKDRVKAMAAKLVNPDALLVVMVGKPKLDTP